MLGDDHPDTLTSRNNLAYAYESAGRLDEAIAAVRADPHRPASGCWATTTRDTLTSRNNLADAYAVGGRSGRGDPLYEQTLTDRERVLGADHPDTLTSRNNLAYAYAVGGRLDEAIPLYEQTLTDSRAGAGRRPPRHPDLAQQPRRRLPVGGRIWTRRSPVRADPHRLASGCWATTTPTP